MPKAGYATAINRPCINITQIGDKIIDCYGGLDERNLLTCGNDLYEQRGFDFHCSDQECIPYHRHCEQRCSNNADSLLCDQFPILWGLNCRDLLCSTRCGCYFSTSECNFIETMQYYCDRARSGE